MKKLFVIYLIVLFLPVKVFCQFTIPDIPIPQTSVYDYAAILTAGEREQLEDKLLNYADSTSTQIVVAIVPTLNGESAESVAPEWAQKWGIGQADKDNGIFILVNYYDREMYIATGFGVQGRLTAGVTSDIIERYFLPDFKDERYYYGLDNGTDAIFQALNGQFKEERDISPDSVDLNQYPKWVKIYSWAFILFFLFVILAVIFSTIRAFIRGEKGNAVTSKGPGGSFRSYTSAGSSRRGFSGGFGGGSFSGGGAGGKW